MDIPCNGRWSLRRNSFSDRQPACPDLVDSQQERHDVRGQESWKTNRFNNFRRMFGSTAKKHQRCIDVTTEHDISWTRNRCWHVMTSKMHTMTSTYDTEFVFKKQELMNTINGISISVWFALMAHILLTSIVMASGIVLIRTTYRRRVPVTMKSLATEIRKMANRSSKHFFKLLVKQSGDDEYGLRMIPFKMIILLTIILGFYTTLFMTAIIKTDAVTVEKPVTIETFDDFLDSNRRPFFFSKTGDYIAFRDAKPGTKKRQIWEKAVMMGVQKSVAPDIDLKEFFDGNLVDFGYHTHDDSSLTLACKLFRELETKWKPLKRFETSDSEIQDAIFRSGHMSVSMSRAIDKMFQKGMEAGYLSMERSNLEKLMGVSLNDDCLENRVVLPNPGFSPISYPQIKLLIGVCTVAVGSAAVMILCEVMISFCKRIRKSIIHPIRVSIEEHNVDL